MLRVVRATMLGIGVFAILVLAIIQGGQHLQRFRSERLLRELQGVNLRVTTVSEVESRVGRWPAESATCDKGSCDYSIQLESPPGWQELSGLAQRFHIRPDLVLHTLMRLGAHPALVNARVEIRNGIAWGKGIRVVVAAPGKKDDLGRWWDLALIGRAESVSALHECCSKDFPADLLRHPDYIIGQPGGCDGPCIEGHVLFTPYAAPEDVRRFMRFDLSCLTRWWHDCRTQTDIMPAAWSEYEREQQLPEGAASQISSPRSVEILGRDASAIAVLRVNRIERRKEPDGYVLLDGHVQSTGKTSVDQRVHAQVLQVLKGSLWHKGEAIILRSPKRELQFHNGQDMIVLLDPIWTEKADNAFAVLPWQVLSPSRENLDRVRAGIAEDFERGVPN